MNKMMFPDQKARVNDRIVVAGGSDFGAYIQQTQGQESDLVKTIATTIPRQKTNE